MCVPRSNKAASRNEPLLRRLPVISVVDDDASIRAAADSLLRARGYNVSTFASAAEFLRSRQLDETSCVITDVRMPDMSGVELQTVLRKQGRSTPFIFITAFPEESARLRALHDGAVCFLSKPFDAPTLIRCVEAALAAGDATSR
jgi:FixJ family two-component response regulator